MRCVTCGFPVGQYMPRFKEAQAKKASDHNKDMAPASALLARTQIDCRDIFAELGIRAVCCQGHMATYVLPADFTGCE